MLKRALRKIVKGQKGQVLIIVLILLALGGLLIVPTLNYASTSLDTHRQVYEPKTLELYAADSGVASALIALSNGETTLDDYELNGKTVSVNITDMDDGSYLITSTATTPGAGSTMIHTGVSSSADFTYFFDNAITSNANVLLQPGSHVVGNVTAAGTVSYDEDNVTGNVTQGETIESWPSAEQLASYYEADVDTGTPFTEDYIDVSYDLITPPYVESLYREGSLDIENTDIDIAYNATLDGTIYVTEYLLIGQEPKDFILDLNGQTIFCEGDIKVSEKCRITGSGCIIAVGDIDFGPNGDVGSEDDFVFIMSVSGTTTLNPGGDFNGSIAGSVDVTLRPGCSLIWNGIGSEGDLNFPYDDVGVLHGSTTDMVLGGWDIS